VLGDERNAIDNRELCVALAQRSQLNRGHASDSRSGKCRLALFHERPAALDEIVAGETLLDQFRASRKIALGFILHDLADNVLDRLHRERRVGGNRLGIVLDVALELALRHEISRAYAGPTTSIRRRNPA